MPKATLNPKNVLTLGGDDGGRVVYFDQGPHAVRGFALRTSARSRAYYQTYRLHGRYVWYRIGDARKVALSAARAEARKVLAKVELGRDPVREREAARDAMEQARAEGTLAALCQGYLHVQESKLSPKTLIYYRWLVSKKIEGTPLGRMKASEVTAADVERHLASVRSKSGDVTGNRVRQLLVTVTRWAVKKGKLTLSPMAAVEGPTVEKPRERVLSDAEVAYLWKALADETPTVGTTAKLLLLLGQRSTSTLEGLRWDSLDLSGKPPTWTIAGKYQKGGRLHVVPLPEPVVKMIEALRPVTGQGERVLDVDQANYNRWWAPIRDRAIDLAREDGLRVERFTRHDLRRTAATGMTKVGVSRFIVEKILAHVESGRRERIAAVYDRNDYLSEKASALATWAAHVEMVASGERRKGDVRAFTRQA